VLTSTTAQVPNPATPNRVAVCESIARMIPMLFIGAGAAVAGLGLRLRVASISVTANQSMSSTRIDILRGTTISSVPYGGTVRRKRLRKLVGTISWLIRALGRDTSQFTDDVWIADSTPVECGRSRETAKRSDLAGFAEYGYCASHSRYFWGLRLHLLCTLQGLPVGAALTGAKADERTVLLDILTDPDLTRHSAQTVIADKNYFGAEFEATLPRLGVTLLRPPRKGEPERPGTRFFKPLRQVIESINDTLKGQLNLEAHGGHTPTGVIVRVWQRLLALTAAIWHNDHISAPVKRSLTAYDH
jgi:hypothetical protein